MNFDVIPSKAAKGSYSLMQERVAALRQANVYGDKIPEAIDIAVKAIEAHEAGAEVYNSFVKHETEAGRELIDTLKLLWYLPEEQPRNAIPGIAFAKMLLAHTTYPSVLECSRRGDQRFCPMFAKLSIAGKERSIDEFYQEAKRTADGLPAGKGKSFDHIIDPYTGDKFSASEGPWLYRGLWIHYFTEHPELVKYAEQFDAFSNIDTGKGIENGYNLIIEAYVKGDRERYVAVVKCSDWCKNMLRKAKSPLSDQIQSASIRASAPHSIFNPPAKESVPPR